MGRLISVPPQPVPLSSLASSRVVRSDTLITLITRYPLFHANWPTPLAAFSGWWAFLALGNSC